MDEKAGWPAGGSNMRLFVNSIDTGDKQCGSFGSSGFELIQKDNGEVHGEQPHALHQVHEELQGCWGVVGHFQCLLQYYSDGGIYSG